MSYTYKTKDGRELPVPSIQEYHIDYLNEMFGMDQYAKAVTPDQLHKVHGMREVVDHLASMSLSQQSQKE